MENTQSQFGKRTIFLGLTLIALAAGCICIPSTNPAVQNSTTPSTTVPACTTKECFISSANECNELNLTFVEKAGVFAYSSSKYCVLTKTLISLNANETTDMKNLLQGKSLTCRYEKGKFDNRWVNSTIFGTEYCKGDLKEALAELIVFT